MKASDYKVTFPYGATTPPYSASHPHTGEDRAMPVGIPVDVGDTTIGLSGNTGKSTGPHLHIQKVKGGVVSPEGKGLAQNISFPATVVTTGFKADIGNYVRLMDAAGAIWSYFHLSVVKVNVGQVIKGGTVSELNLNQARILDYHIAGRNGYEGFSNSLDGSNDEDLKKNHVGKDAADEIDAFFVSQEGDAWRNRLKDIVWQRDDYKAKYEALEAGQSYEPVAGLTYNGEQVFIKKKGK